LINATTVSAIFHIVPDAGGNGLHFEFQFAEGAHPRRALPPS
jgi:hypothetical protein